MCLTIQIEADADEASRGCEAIAASVYPRSYAFWITLAVYFLVGIAAVLFAADAAVVTFLIALWAVIALGWALQAEGRWRRRRALAADPHRDEPHFVEISEEGIRMYCDHVDSRITWSGITSVRETAEFYLFVRGATGGIPLPKRALSPATDREIRAGVRQWSPDAGAGLLPDPLGHVAPSPV